MNLSAFTVLDAKDREDGLTVSVVHDTDGSNPREWANVSRLACSHSRWDMPNDTNLYFDPYEPDWLEISRVLVRDYEALIVMPVAITGDFALSAIVADTEDYKRAPTALWQSRNIVGCVFCTKASYEECCGDWTDSPENFQNAIQCMQEEVRLYGQYVNGECYGYIITDGDGDVIDDLWGFVGDVDDCMSEGMAAADGHSEAIQRLEPGLRALQQHLRKGGPCTQQ